MIEYKKILLKLSGNFLHESKYLKKLSEVIKTIQEEEIKIAIVVGGGNILRGRNFANIGEKRRNADVMGMYATVINGIFLTDILNSSGLKTIHLSSLNGKYTEPYDPLKAKEYLEEKLVIISGGTGAPFFSTDTAGVLRGCEMDIDLMIKGTDVDGVYSKNPKTGNAKKFSSITYKEIIEKELKVLDLTAISLAWEFSLPIVVLNMTEPENLLFLLNGEKKGTFIGR